MARPLFNFPPSICIYFQHNSLTAIHPHSTLLFGVHSYFISKVFNWRCFGTFTTNLCWLVRMAHYRIYWLFTYFITKYLSVELFDFHYQLLLTFLGMFITSVYWLFHLLHYKTFCWRFSEFPLHMFVTLYVKIITKLCCTVRNLLQTFVSLLVNLTSLQTFVWLLVISLQSFNCVHNTSLQIFVWLAK